MTYNLCNSLSFLKQCNYFYSRICYAMFQQLPFIILVLLQFVLWIAFYVVFFVPFVMCNIPNNEQAGVVLPSVLYN